MSFSFRPAKREGVQLLIGIAGPSASGKTLSALKIAAGLAGGKPFAYVDTESGRALHYADDFDFLHTELAPPFTPARYREAIADAVALNPPVIVVDSMSHEHSGPGGVLEMHEADLDRRAGSDFKKRDALNMSAWIKPKQERKLLIDDLLRLRCHVILCFRAEEKVDIVPDPEKPGKTKIVPKRTIAGHVGWIPVAGKEYAYELTLSLVVTPDKPGVPHAIKIMDRHRPFVSLETPLDEKVGKLLGEWAAGGSLAKGAGAAVEPAGGSGGEDAGTSAAPSASDLAEIETLRETLLEKAAQLDARAATEESIGRNRVAAEEAQDLAAHVAWLKRCIAAADETIADRQKAAESEGGESTAGSMSPPSESAEPSLFESIAKGKS